MKTKSLAIACCCLLASSVSAVAASKLVVTVSNASRLARPSETIAVPWAEIVKAFPDALLQHLQVTDPDGKVLPYQVTNLAPLDSEGAYGDFLFQHDFKAGETSAKFVVTQIDEVAPVFPPKVFARYVPERLDDFAWENDKLAHRTYGTALAAPAVPGSNKEVLVSSGIDIWSKRVNYLIVDRWYNKGHNHYHVDEGEGMDMYQVGRTRGTGGTGVWDGEKLYVSVNYSKWKVLANGPVRAIFELSYEPWDAAGVSVSEVKRFTVDVGHYLDSVESTFTFTGPESIMIAVGINKSSGDRGQDAVAQVTKNPEQAWFTQWEVQKTNGSLGEAVVMSPRVFSHFAQDEHNHLVLARAVSGKPVHYLVGGAWSKAGEITSQSDWDAYVAARAAREVAPVSVSYSVE